MPPRVTKRLSSMSLSVLVWVHLLSLSNAWIEAKCQESPPNCSTTFKYSFKKVQHNPVMPIDVDNYTSINYYINSSLPICSLNLFKILPNLPSASALFISLFCQTPNTRIVIVSNDNFAISTTKPYHLVVINCTMYWKDLSTLGRKGQLETLELNDWKDEFALREASFFSPCVELKNSSGDFTKAGPQLAISGMATVKWVTVLNKEVRPLGPGFTQYRWPMMQQLACVRWYILVYSCV